MLLLLYRSLTTDRGRVLLSILAVGAAVALVIILEGFKEGLWEQVREYRDHFHAELVALPAGATNTIQTRASMPHETADLVAAVPGVQRVHRVVNVPAILDTNEAKSPIFVVGYGEAGGPWRLAEGREVRASGEAVIDRAVARKHRLGVGDRVPLLSREFVIVGLSARTSSLLGSYVFIPLDDAFALLTALQGPQEADGGGETPTFLLVETGAGTDASSVRSAIEAAAPGVDMFTPAEIAAKDVELIKDLMGSVTNLIVVVAYIVGVMVIGLTLYAATLERAREYGIMKALGVRASALYRYVLGQASLFTVVGLGAGIVGGLVAARLIDALVPQYRIDVLETPVLLRTAIAAIAMALIAALLPARHVANVDPMAVFKQ